MTKDQDNFNEPILRKKLNDNKCTKFSTPNTNKRNLEDDISNREQTVESNHSLRRGF